MNSYIPTQDELAKLSDVELLNETLAAASLGNECDNRSAVAAYRLELLRRLTERWEAGRRRREALLRCRNLTRQQETSPETVGEVGRMVGKIVEEALK